MKPDIKIFTILGLFCLGLCSSAQSTSDNGIPGAIAVRPANTSGGKILNMEETILSRELSPSGASCFWSEDHILQKRMKDGRIMTIDFLNGGIETEAEVQEKSPGKLPEKVKRCKNLVKSPEGEGTGTLYAFTVKNNLYICDSTGKTDTVTAEKDRSIVCGQTVSRNEFGISGGIFWSPDASKLAYYIKDESAVTRYPLTDITSRTGRARNIRYPMAGMDSEKIKVAVYDLKTKRSVYLNHMAAVDPAWDRADETYLTNVCWSPDGKSIYIQLLDRSQKHMKLCMFDPNGNYVKTILTEDNGKYVEPLDPLYFIKGRNDIFIYRTANRDGYRNLYLCDNDGNVRRITEVDADVKYLDNDGENIYYTSAEVSPVENHLFRIGVRNLKKGVTKASVGKAQRLTCEEGWHHIALSPDCRYFIDSYSSISVPRVLDLYSADGTKIMNLYTAEDPTTDYAYSEIVLGTVKSADGLYDNYYRLIKPNDFDPEKKYPVIVYVYGGPHSQMVNNSFMASLRRWEMYMAQRGYLVYVQDNRGTENRGLAFEQAIHGQCGQMEMADQMEGVKMLMGLPFVDKDRIGVHGWSYGGFMTISLATNYPEIFKVAVAGGPVIDWKWYEVMYGERYMDSPHVNPEGYEKTSLISKAKDLKAKLLICQGTIDPVVVWQHSLSFIQECINNNVQVDYFPYPRAEHNMMGMERVHLHNKISAYFDDYL